jgi:hypothetical protein
VIQSQHTDGAFAATSGFVTRDTGNETFDITLVMLKVFFYIKKILKELSEL